jgi:hypothetical protein
VLFATPGVASQLVHDLDGAKTDEAANAIMAKIKKWLTPAAVGKGAGPHASRFVENGDDICRAIIRNFSFAAEPDPIEPIRKVLRATLTDTAVEDFAKAAIGMAKEAAEANMRKHLDSVVDAKSFRAHFQAFVRKYNLAGLLNSTTGDPDQAEINRTIRSSPTYVRQLNSVALSQEIIVGAVAAYLRTTADRVKWAEDGEIVESSLADFDQGLERKFTLLRDEVEDVHSTKEEKERGRMIYRRCSGVLLPLEDRTVPSYFVEGAYNILANDVRVGWHPSYKKLMGKGG